MRKLKFVYEILVLTYSYNIQQMHNKFIIYIEWNGKPIK